jgi:flavin-dependent dehydrogenase
MSRAMARRFDVLVIGAGPSGAALAQALRRRSFEVALLDVGRQPERRVGESLHAVGRRLLDELGLGDRFERQGHRPSYLLRSSWGGEGRISERRAIDHRLGPSWHVDRARFDAWLADEARRAGAELLRPARVERVTRDGPCGWRVHAVVGARSFEIDARFLIDATGRTAWLARRLGAVRRSADRLVGIARWFVPADVEPFMLVEATESGWWYTAPTPDNELVALLVTDASLDAAESARSDRWEREIVRARSTQARVGPSRSIGRPHVSLAAPAVTEWDTSQSWLPVGDAAVAFDPISGDGLCFALRSALEAAWVLDARRAGSRNALAAYRNGVQDVYEHHLKRRAVLYRAEPRWPSSPFWSRWRTPTRSSIAEA